MTEKEAIEFMESKKYEGMTSREIVELQLYEPLLCVPFDIFHKAVAKELKRTVIDTEFIKIEILRQEFEGLIPTPSLEEVIRKCREIVREKDPNVKYGVLL